MAPRPARRAWRRRSAPGAWLLAAAVAAAAAAAAQGWGFALFAGRGPSGQLPFRGRSASNVLVRATEEAEVKEYHPVTKLQNLVAKLIGRRIREGDIVYSFLTVTGNNDSSTSSARAVAQVKLGCFEGQPERTGTAREGKKAAKRAVAEMLLADADFLAELILAKVNPEADTKTTEKRPAKGKKAEGKTKGEAAADEPEPAEATEEKPRTPLADIALGQEVSGVVKGGNSGGVYIDVGAAVDAYLPVAEMGQGFPREQPFRNGTSVSGRVLWKADDESKFWISRRKGDLVGPLQEPLDFNASVLEGVSSDEWLDGKVVRMTYENVKVEVSPPGGGSPVAGLLRSSDFSAAFFAEAAMGGPVRVRVKNIRPDGRVDFTMQSEGGLKISDMVVGQELTGKVRNRLGGAQGTRNAGQGWFLDVGAERDAFLDTEESADGYPAGVSLRSGTEVSVRVLRLSEDGKVWVTRRSGDLARPEDRLYRNLGSIEQFEGVSPADWLEGQVVRLRPPGQIFVRVTPPTGEAAVGLLNLQDTPKSFKAEVWPGMDVKVRVKKVNVTRKRMLLTMKTAPAAEAEAPAGAAAGEEPAEAGEPAEEPEAPEEAAGEEPEPEAPPEPPVTTPPPEKKEEDLFSFLKR